MTEQDVLRRQIAQWLAERGLRLHPRKMYLQHYSKGVMFVGGMIKPGRKYLSHRTRGRLYARVSPAWYRHVWFSRRGRRVKAVMRMADSAYARKRNNLRA